MQKSATYLLQYSVKSELDVNFGQPLPVSGLSLYKLLQSVAEDEKIELFQSNGGNGASEHVASVSNSTSSQKRHLAASIDGDSRVSPLMSSRLLVDAEGRLYRRLLTATDAAAAGSPPSKPPKKKPSPKAKPAPAPLDTTATSVNALVRLLQKIPVEDIKKLQTEVMIHAAHYRYYSFNSSLPVDAPPVTAVHTFPDGGALHQLDRMLELRKRKGVVAVSELCQVCS